MGRCPRQRPGNALGGVPDPGSNHRQFSCKAAWRSKRESNACLARALQLQDGPTMAGDASNRH